MTARIIGHDSMSVEAASWSLQGCCVQHSMLTYHINLWTEGVCNKLFFVASEPLNNDLNGIMKHGCGVGMEGARHSGHFRSAAVAPA